jgi:hypothetical protein
LFMPTPETPETTGQPPEPTPEELQAMLATGIEALDAMPEVTQRKLGTQIAETVLQAVEANQQGVIELQQRYEALQQQGQEVSAEQAAADFEQVQMQVGQVLGAGVQQNIAPLVQEAVPEDKREVAMIAATQAVISQLQHIQLQQAAKQVETLPEEQQAEAIAQLEAMAEQNGFPSPFQKEGAARHEDPVARAKQSEIEVSAAQREQPAADASPVDHTNQQQGPVARATRSEIEVPQAQPQPKAETEQVQPVGSPAVDKILANGPQKPAQRGAANTLDGPGIQ